MSQRPTVKEAGLLFVEVQSFIVGASALFDTRNTYVVIVEYHYWLKGINGFMFVLIKSTFIVLSCECKTRIIRMYRYTNLLRVNIHQNENRTFFMTKLLIPVELLLLIISFMISDLR